MSAEIVPLATPELDALGVEIRSAVKSVEERWRGTLAAAIRLGELLIEAKAQLKHGQWLPWLEANFPKSEKSAQSYMRLARKSAEIADLPSVAAALATIAEPRDDLPPAVEPEVARGEVVPDDLPPAPEPAADPPAPEPEPETPQPPPERLPSLAIPVREARANLRRARAIARNMAAAPAPDDYDVARAALVELDAVEVEMAALHADVRRMLSAEGIR
jgi:hypothetical protein